MVTVGDEFGWVEGWSGPKNFGPGPDFQEPVPAEIGGVPDFFPDPAVPLVSATSGVELEQPAAADRPPVDPPPPVVSASVSSGRPIGDVVDPVPMVRALNAALRAAALDPRDGAAVNLARLLARSVDEGRMQDAPKLLSVMTSLGLTPGGRRPPPAVGEPGAVVVEGVPSGVVALARIRAARAAKGSE